MLLMIHDAKMVIIEGNHIQIYETGIFEGIRLNKILRPNSYCNLLVQLF